MPKNFKCLSEKLAAAFRVLDRTFSVLWGLAPCIKHIDFPPYTLFLRVPPRHRTATVIPRSRCCVRSEPDLSAKAEDLFTLRG